MAPRRILQRRIRLGPGVLTRVPTTPVRKVGPQGDRRGTTTTFKADPEVFETVEFSFDTIAQRLRESAYLKQGSLDPIAR